MKKTTIEISPATLARVREVQRRDAVTLKDLVEEGLNMALDARAVPRPYRFEPVVVGGLGDGSAASAANTDLEALLVASRHEDRPGVQAFLAEAAFEQPPMRRQA